MPFTSGFYTCWEETSLQGKESECAAIHLQSMPLYSRDFRSTCHTHLWACTITYWILFQHSSFDCDPARWAAVTSLFTGLATASNHTEATAMQSWGYLGRKNERQTNCSSSMLNKASSLTSLRSGEGLPQIHVLQRSRGTSASPKSNASCSAPPLRLIFKVLLNCSLRCLSSFVQGTLHSSVQWRADKCQTGLFAAFWQMSAALLLARGNKTCEGDLWVNLKAHYCIFLSIRNWNTAAENDFLC